MKKVADKAYLPAMRELLDYYTAIRDGEEGVDMLHCPLCRVETELYPNSCECESCPWVVYTRYICDSSSKQVYGHDYDTTLPDITDMRRDPTKRWLSTRIRQLTSWIKRTEA